MTSYGFGRESNLRQSYNTHKLHIAACKQDLKKPCCNNWLLRTVLRLLITKTKPYDINLERKTWETFQDVTSVSPNLTQQFTWHIFLGLIRRKHVTVIVSHFKNDDKIKLILFGFEPFNSFYTTKERVFTDQPPDKSLHAFYFSWAKNRKVFFYLANRGRTDRQDTRRDIYPAE